MAQVGGLRTKTIQAVAPKGAHSGASRPVQLWAPQAFPPSTEKNGQTGHFSSSDQILTEPLIDRKKTLREGHTQ